MEHPSKGDTIYSYYAAEIKKAESRLEEIESELEKLRGQVHLVEDHLALADDRLERTNIPAVAAVPLREMEKTSRARHALTAQLSRLIIEKIGLEKRITAWGYEDRKIDALSRGNSGVGVN